ncbi:MAG: ArsR family transcriptional regulator [Comamonadaceae bacterium]|nr:MAG: ArsR family transcriptional regulator [Comamonadaceae bacterium]
MTVTSNYQTEASPGASSEAEGSRAESGGALPITTASSAVRVLKAIAQETRLRIIELLQQKNSSGLPAGVIAASLDILPNLISFHLKELSGAGILLKKTVGRNIIYSVDAQFLESFFIYLQKYRISS